MDSAEHAGANGPANELYIARTVECAKHGRKASISAAGWRPPSRGHRRSGGELAAKTACQNPANALAKRGELAAKTVLKPRQAGNLPA